MKVVGVSNSGVGEYQGRRYHNLVLHVTYKEANANKDVIGLLTDTVKLRYADLNNIFSMGLADPADSEKLGADTFSYLLGAEIEVAYNKFGAVQSVTILEEAPKSPVKPASTANHAVNK